MISDIAFSVCAKLCAPEVELELHRLTNANETFQADDRQNKRRPGFALSSTTSEDGEGQFGQPRVLPPPPSSMTRMAEISHCHPADANFQ